MGKKWHITYASMVFTLLVLNKFKTMETYLGSIELFPYNFAPMDWLLCDGRLLEIRSNQALFALLGTTYGGDGRINFAIPDFQGYEPIPCIQYHIAVIGLFPTRK